MKRKMIADARTGLRPLTDEQVLTGIFNGDLLALELENGCVIYDDDRPNYHTQDGREFAEVLELANQNDRLGQQVIGYTEIKNRKPDF